MRHPRRERLPAGLAGTGTTGHVHGGRPHGGPDSPAGGGARHRRPPVEAGWRASSSAASARSNAAHGPHMSDVGNAEPPHPGVEHMTRWGMTCAPDWRLTPHPRGRARSTGRSWGYAWCASSNSFPGRVGGWGARSRWVPARRDLCRLGQRGSVPAVARIAATTDRR